MMDKATEMEKLRMMCLQAAISQGFKTYEGTLAAAKAYVKYINGK